MKNKVSEPGDSIFKKKGFFIALYSCLGAVMVLALVISFTNLMSSPDANETARAPETQNNSQAVGADTYDSYLPKAQAQEQAELDEQQAWRRPTAKPAETTAPAVPTVTPAPRPSVTQTPYLPVPADTASPAPDATPAPTADTPAAEAETPAAEADSDSDKSSEMAFSPFSENDKLIWPVYGDIAMVFSMDKLVYDPTLDQYRTNDDLRISAQEGTPVKACADGRVLEVDNDTVYGNYVKIEHGNGWVTTYGQLMDGVLIKEGEVVKAGQVIGGVGKPSYYGSLNGTHVNLRVTREDEPVDPRGLLVDGQ